MGDEQSKICCHDDDGGRDCDPQTSRSMQDGPDELGVREGSLNQVCDPSLHEPERTDHWYMVQRDKQHVEDRRTRANICKQSWPNRLPVPSAPDPKREKEQQLQQEYGDVRLGARIGKRVPDNFGQASKHGMSFLAEGQRSTRRTTGQQRIAASSRDR